MGASSNPHAASVSTTSELLQPTLVHFLHALFNYAYNSLLYYAITISVCYVCSGLHNISDTRLFIQV